MASDIELGDEEVKITGSVLRLTAFDVTLDNQTRRGSGNPDRPRRALVHGPDDSLVVNWDGDYPSGVTINGPVKFPGSIDAQDGKFTRLGVAGAIDAQDGKFMRLEVGGGFRVKHLGAMSLKVPLPALDVVDELIALRDRIEALEAAIAELRNH